MMITIYKNNTCNHKKKLLEIFPLPRLKYTLSLMNMLQSHMLPPNPMSKCHKKS